MERHSKIVVFMGLVFCMLIISKGIGWTQTPNYIPFAGVTNVNTISGPMTNLDLGISVPLSSVAEAYVIFPDGSRQDFVPADFLTAFGEYFKSLSGQPALGEYKFTLNLTDGTSQTVSDIQTNLENLYIIQGSEYEIIGGDGVTPTIRWPRVENRFLFYRLRIFDMLNNMVVNGPIGGGTSYVVSPGQLMPNTTYQLRVEVHDSSYFAALQNRSNGQRLEFTTGDLPGPQSGTLKVIPVPWVADAPLIPHDAYNGKTITFKAIARGGNGTYSYEWDFNGDGIYDFSNSTSNPYDLSAKHMYPDQLFDRIFVARIRVTSGGEVVTAEYPVRVHPTATRSVKVNVAIDEALWWLHQNFVRFDSGLIQYGGLTEQALGSTGAAVQAWENQGHKPGGNFDNNPYIEDVRRGMNSILSRTGPYPVYTEDSRNPDTNANGYGLHSNLQSQLYETGIVLMALASAGNPGLTCEVGGFGMLGRTYGEISQDMADFLAFAQNEPTVGVWRGGWRYGPNYAQSDMSVTQWPVIGLEAAETNFGTAVPPYVKSELEIYLGVDQDSDGGFGYTAPGGNVARTGAGIACLAWINAPAADSRVTKAIDFINNRWTSDNMGNLYAMYAVMKGMRGFEPDIKMLGSHDWYAEYADFLINTQAVDGSWTSSTWYEKPLSTATGVLILTPEVFQAPPVAVAGASPTEASPGTVITFDHYRSFHRDPSRTLSQFRWDFNEDGGWDFSTADLYARPIWVYDDVIGCGEEVQHRVVLEVVDDLGNTGTDDETVIIRINLNNHPPVADGDPTDSNPNYIAPAGATILLDGSQSFDPDPGDSITKWEWDLNNDGVFEASGQTYLFQIPPSWEPGSTHTVTLRVTDDGSWATQCGGVPNLIDQTTITINVTSGLDCSTAQPSLARLWPPNHLMVPIKIMGVSGSTGTPANITITGITQDEPVNGLGDGDKAPDGKGVGSNQAQVRAERSGRENGRVYEITFMASDHLGAQCTGAVAVFIPHDEKGEAVDDGQMYDSTQWQ